MPVSERIARKLDELADRHESISRDLEAPETMANHQRMADLLRERGKLDTAHELRGRLRSLRDRRDQARELVDSGDREMVELAEVELEELETEEESLDGEIKSCLVASDGEERDSVIVEIRAGAGGDEAALWAGDLLRMYKRYAEANRWTLELLNASEAEGGGYKEVGFRVKGTPEVWRQLRFEAGGHRVQRVPETESQGRIHTSAATVAVLAEVDDVEIDIKPEDLDISAMRAGGPGGQHQNKTSSAIRIVHKPTGETVVCREKSQHQNRKEAMRILKSRLWQREQDKAQSERAEQRRTMLGSGDRSQRIRTYNYPQNRVTDHRISQNFSLELIIQGRLDAMIHALKEFDREERLAQL